MPVIVTFIWTVVFLWGLVAIGEGKTAFAIVFVGGCIWGVKQLLNN